jgi:hypothetical protein
MMPELLHKHSIVGVCANRNEGKTSLVLTELRRLKRQYPHLKVCVLGLNPELKDVCINNGFTFLVSKTDILDLKVRDAVIYIDEMGILFDTKSQSKQLDKLMRFFDRIEHNNCKLIVSTAREGYFNKFMCGRITAFLVKQIEYESLVNGTWLNERVRAVDSLSDYRLECGVNEFFVVTNKDETTVKHTFEYVKSFDTKRNNKDLFAIPKIVTQNVTNIVTEKVNL